jgi:hypothetical protein
VERNFGCKMSMNQFFEFDTFTADSFGVSCLEFDSQYDLLLVGNVEGRLSSFYLTDIPLETDKPDEYQARWGKYSSVAVAHDAVLDILPTPRHVLSLSRSHIAASTVGGLRHGTIPVPSVEEIGEHEFR